MTIKFYVGLVIAVVFAVMANSPINSFTTQQAEAATQCVKCCYAAHAKCLRRTMGNDSCQSALAACLKICVKRPNSACVFRRVGLIGPDVDIEYYPWLATCLT